MTEHKYDLNLPTTEFPMRGDLAKREPEILKRWQEKNLYQKIQQATQNKPLFILHDGPPYANGNVHLGHSVNKILKDIVIKSKVLQGFQAPFIPGWDCHGLPIELKVEALVGKPNDKISAKEFRKHCREYAKSQVEAQRSDFIRMGVQADWYNPYLTMDFVTEANILRTLGKAIAENHLYKGVKPVHWCLDCGSSLAEAEVEYHNKKSPSIYVKFKSTENFGFDLPVFAVIWTTTPWTLPSNQAIAANEKVIYNFVQVNDAIFIIAKDLVENLASELNWQDFEIKGEIVGSLLEHKLFEHPFYDKKIPIILGDHVSVEDGTGLVHTAPDHGQEDFLVSKKYGIETLSLVNDRGCFKEKVQFFANLNVFQANQPVIDKLTENQCLLKHKQIEHSYPHCWRHKTPIIFRATSQWFISMEQQKLKEKALAEIKKVNWIPDWGFNRIETMLSNRPDWCISRQRVWGIPLALFIDREEETLHPETNEIIEKVALLVEEQGIQAWWDVEPKDLGVDETKYRKITDTLDVWFDSGSTYNSVVNQRKEFQGKEIDLYLEGSDQHRGWFMSSLMLSVATQNKAPYKEVLTHGFVVDEKGHKMSKSLGNVIVPSEIWNKNGADILRLWVASTDYSAEMSLSHNILNNVAESYRRIRNTARFLLANLNDFDPATDLVKENEMLALDRWAVNCAYLTQKDIIKGYESYQFHLVVQRLMRFCSVEMGSFYLDLIKDRQYTSAKNSLARRSCQTAIWHIAESLVRWIAPILSFTADEIWQHLPQTQGREEFVFTGEFYSDLFALPENAEMDDDFWQLILKVRTEVNKLLEENRKNKIIGSSLDAKVILYLDEKLRSQIAKLGDELKFALLVSQVEIKDLTKEMQNNKAIEGLAIEVIKATGKKCARCWHYSDEVGSDPNHPDLCPRCLKNMFGDGEKRYFV